MQIVQVCKEICVIKQNKPTNAIQSPPNTYCTKKELLPDKYEKGERDCTRSTDNKSCDHYEGPHNSQNIPANHAESVPCMLPLPEPPEPTSSPASSEPSSSLTSISCDEPSCNLTDGTFALMMELSSSQKETKELLKEQDSRGGGLAG